MENLFLFSFGIFILGLVIVAYQAISFQKKHHKK